MEGWAKVIAAASTSPLGILALIILVISGLAFQFFKDSGSRVKVGIFIPILLAAVGYGVAVVNAGSSKSTTSVVPSLSPTRPDVQATANPSGGGEGGGAPSNVILTSREPAAGGGGGAPCGLFPDSSSRLLNDSELGSLSGRELKIARNTIYARHGYIFKTDDMRDYFGRCSWYAPTAEQVSLNGVEQANVAAIQRAEGGR